MYGHEIINIENTGVAKFTLKSEHATLRAIKLNTSTDDHDTLVLETKKHLFRGNIAETEGQIFILSDILSNIATVFIIPAPDCFIPTLSVREKKVEIKTGGYPVSLGRVKCEDAERMCRDWYRMHYHCSGLHSMSNTWGDRNGRTRVSDEFLRKEIDSGADLGLDVVQIDDGWQNGIPNTYDEDGCRVFADDFWELKTSIFSHGMRAISDYAAEKGVSLGLWFAPESRGVFGKIVRDLDVLKKAYDEWGIRYYKLDMLQLTTQKHCDRMLVFLDAVFTLGDDVSVELDVTADKRLGYLMSAPYGTIFVENRYTAWSNYYPHRTLRNLWSLSAFMPTSKFQFELVNPELYTDAYSKDDPLRPETYDIDYLFASVMLSNPLFWMETQFLSDDCRARLKGIIPIWKEHRAALSEADVRPIGEEPCGTSMTGFFAECTDSHYAVVFREVTERDSFTYKLPVNSSEYEIIASNTDAEISLSNGNLTVKFGKMRAYVWLKIK